MQWTKKQYDALFLWAEGKKGEAEKNLTKEIISRLENAESMGVWYKLVQEARDSVGVEIVEQPGKEADAQLSAYLSRIGKKGGSVKSDKKAAASRENGKKGGRPRKERG